jgi:hypothetical protein
MVWVKESIGWDFIISSFIGDHSLIQNFNPKDHTPNVSSNFSLLVLRFLVLAILSTPDPLPPSDLALAIAFWGPFVTSGVVID